MMPHDAEPTKGECTRQRILEIAAPLFNQRGYAGCALSDIMAATGLEKGGIYRHFGNKQQLAAEAFDYAWATMRDRRRQGMDGIADPLERLKRHVANFLERAAFPGGCPLLNTGADSDDGDPLLRARAREALRDWKSMLHGIIDEGRRASLIRAEADPERIVTIMVAALEGGALLSRIERNDRSRHTILEFLYGFLDAELRPAKPLRIA